MTLINGSDAGCRTTEAGAHILGGGGGGGGLNMKRALAPRKNAWYGTLKAFHLNF